MSVLPLRQLASDPSVPVEGGSANDYDYCSADPVNCNDLSGEDSRYDVVDDSFEALQPGTNFLVSISLRRGNHNWITGGGWGRDHIKRKHGWGYLSQWATRYTLLAGKATPQRGSLTSYRYEAWINVPCGCGRTRRVKWIVVVEWSSGRKGDNTIG